jgi:prepilin-type N-terminal cleavage/methylation domain-containing protein
MTGRQPHRAQLNAGFTLLEMLVVLTVLALVGVLVVPRLARPPDHAAFLKPPPAM